MKEARDLHPRSATRSYVLAAMLTMASLLTALVSQVNGLSAASYVNWTQFAFDATHSNYNPYESTITPSTVGGLHLAFESSMGPYRNSFSAAGIVHQPVVVNGVVFGAARDELYAFNATTGARIWHHLGCGPGPLNMPAYAAGRLWTGGSAGTISVFDASSGAVTCLPDDTYVVGKNQVNPPAVVGDIVYITDHRGRLNAYYAPSLELAWSVNLQSQPLQPPAYDATTDALYISTASGFLYAVDARTGGVNWMLNLTLGGFDYLFPVSTAGDTVLVGIYLDDLVDLDARTGAWIWNNEADCGEGATYEMQSVAHGHAYQSDIDCGMYAFSLTTGKVVWMRGVDYGSGDPMTVAGAVLYGSDLRMARSGRFLGSSPRLGFTPAVVNGTVYGISISGGNVVLTAYRV